MPSLICSRNAEKVTQVWLYNEDAKLIGENILEDPGTRQFWKMEPSEVRTNEQQLALLEPQLQELLAARS